MCVSCSVGCYQVEVSATGRSLVERSPTECRMCDCNQGNSRIRSGHTRTVRPWKQATTDGNLYPVKWEVQKINVYITWIKKRYRRKMHISTVICLKGLEEIKRPWTLIFWLSLKTQPDNLNLKKKYGFYWANMFGLKPVIITNLLAPPESPWGNNDVNFCFSWHMVHFSLLHIPYNNGTTLQFRVCDSTRIQVPITRQTVNVTEGIAQFKSW
jgi:hypothetical protein